MNNNTSLITGIVVLVVVLGAVFYFFRSGDSSTTGLNTGSTYGTGLGNNGGTGGSSGSGSNTGGANGSPTSSLKPIVSTEDFASVSSTTAVVAGTVDPRGMATTYWVEYGTTPNFGQSVAVREAGAGLGVLGVGAYITGLKSNTQYYFRVGAQNANGRVYGSVYSFITAAK